MKTRIIKKCVNGEIVENIIEFDEEKELAEQQKRKYAERTRPRTLEEGMLEFQKTLLEQHLKDNDDKTLAIACMAFFEPWTPGQYEVGDIRTNPATGYPKECITTHDSTVNTDWTIDVGTIWKAYHSRKKEYALPWEQPTGSHDMYKTGEYMIWTDNEIYKCVSDTNFSPEEYPQAWEKA